MKKSDRAPQDQNHHHYGGDHQDLHRLGGRFVHALRVLPPKVKSDQNAEDSGKRVFGEIVKWVPEVESGVLNKAGKVLSGHNGTEGASQDVVEQQGGYGKFRQRSAHGPPDYAVNAAADEHAGGLAI